MSEPEFEYQLPGWEERHSEEYKLKYFRQYVDMTSRELEEAEIELEFLIRSYWKKSKGHIEHVDGGKKCNTVPYQIKSVN